MEISVMIPVYNKRRYLAVLLEQMRTQRFADFECLLLDDGSTDGSGAICDAFAARDDRFRVFHIPHSGASEARNFGLSQAAGRYITFVDADDQIHPELLWELHRCAVESGAGLVIGNLQKVWTDRTEILPMPHQGLVSMDRLLPRFARLQQETGLYGYCTAKLIHRTLLQGVRFHPGIRLAEDLDFYLEIYPKVESICFAPVPHYSYLQSAENSSMQRPDDQIDYFTQLTIQQKLVRFLQQKQAFSGENRQIMAARLSDYVYFCLFHSAPAETRRMCARIRRLDLPPLLGRAGDPVRKRVILWLYDRKLDGLMVLALGAYRILRGMLRGAPWN